MEGGGATAAAEADWEHALERAPRSAALGPVPGSVKLEPRAGADEAGAPGEQPQQQVFVEHICVKVEPEFVACESETTAPCGSEPAIPHAAPLPSPEPHGTVKLEPESVGEAEVKEEPECGSETAGWCGRETEQLTQHSERESWPTLTIEPIGGSWLAPRAPLTLRPPPQCHVCAKQFKEPSKLKEHMRLHTGEKPYPCKTCDKRFARRSILKVHERTHTGEKPFCCKICNRRFTDARSLKTHDLIHARNPYSCDVCNRNFADPDTLTEHKLFHISGETEY